MFRISPTSAFLTVFFPSLLVPKSAALFLSGKSEYSASREKCQEQSALFLKNF
jgi:hypothetical protein